MLTKIESFFQIFLRKLQVPEVLKPIKLLDRNFEKFARFLFQVHASFFKSGFWRNLGSNSNLYWLSVSSDLDSGETLEDRTRDAARLLDVLLDAISQELSDVESGKDPVHSWSVLRGHVPFSNTFKSPLVQNRFFESFAKAIGVDPDSLDEVKSASIVQLSEDECRTALSIAVKTIADTKKMNQIRSSQADAFLKLSEFRNKQRCEWDKKAGELAQDVNRLNAAAEAREKETRKMASSLKKCSKRLNILVSSAPQTASKGISNRHMSRPERVNS